MAGVAGPELVTAVSAAGGLGVIAALRLTPDALRDAIAQVRTATDKPFGVNIWLHTDVRTPPDPDSIPDDVVRGSQNVLNHFRPRFDLPTRLDRPARPAATIDTSIEIMIEERVPVFSAGLGVPEPELVERFHAVGTTVLCMVTSVADGIEAANNGVDVIAAQGTEAGGHRSYGTKPHRSGATGTSCLTLVPELVDALAGAAPVIAAGGIVDGRGLAAMMALGADGVLLGTRFVATRESAAAEIWKQRLTSGDRATTITDGFSGQWARVLSSEFTEHWADSGAEALPGLLQAAAGSDLFGAAKAAHDDQLQPLYAGTGSPLLHDVPLASEVINTMVSDAAALLAPVDVREIAEIDARGASASV